MRLRRQALFLMKGDGRPVYLLKTSAFFDSAHFLAGYDGKCANLHGHRWQIEATLCGGMLSTSGAKRGMLMDFSDFKREVRLLAEQFDHALIFESGTLQATTLAALESENFRLIAVPFPPTAENLAAYFSQLLCDRGLPVRSVAVFETPENGAVFERPDCEVGS